MHDETFYEHFKRTRISVDICPTFEACSTFNLSIKDNYNIAFALLKLEIPRNEKGEEIMPSENYPE